MLKKIFSLKSLPGIFALLVAFSCQTKKDELKSLPALFSDNMVLQQNTEVAVWGKSSAKANVLIKAGWGEEISAKADENGDWKAMLKTGEADLKAYELSIQCGDSIHAIKNILLGEVWLASGQSNMAMPLIGWPPQDTILNSANEIANSANKSIRMFTVARDVSFTEKENCNGVWEMANPETTKNFSATAYFFAKNLYRELKVPIGIIHSSWGGTPVESWISNKYLAEDVDFKEQIAKIKKSIPQNEKLNNWLDSLPKVEPKKIEGEIDFSGLDFHDSECSKPGFDDSKWKTMKLPQAWEQTEVGYFDGAVWFRKQIEIPENWIGKELVLVLGAIDDMDISFVNGKEVGKIDKEGFWQTDRVYTVPADLVTGKIVSIAIRVIDNQGGGGIFGGKESMKIYLKDNKSELLSLEGDWKYLPVAEFRNNLFYVFGVENRGYYKRPKVETPMTAYTPTTLYNAMIAPLIPYTIKGAIWYQGESNVGRHEQYARTFPLMIKNWRESRELGDFPFYFVQIAPYNYGEQGSSGALRNAQRLSLSTPNTGMAVTLDIGNFNNIHPANKQDVGKRLALWALAKDYAKEMLYSGPLYASKTIESDKVILSFTEIGSGLELKKANFSGFEIAGENGEFFPAKAEINGDKVIVSSTKVKEPKQVRYAWANGAEATLFNKEGLPASTFITD